MLILTYETIPGRISEDYRNALSQVLSASGSDHTVEFREADEELAGKLEGWKETESLLSLFAEYAEDTTNTRLLIAAPNQGKFKNHCLSEASHAQWGCCLSETIAVEYSPDENALETQLHESLHLFGVDECYEESTLQPKPSCLNTRCVMRYGVQSTEVCQSVQQQLMG